MDQTKKSVFNIDIISKNIVKNHIKFPATSACALIVTTLFIWLINEAETKSMSNVLLINLFAGGLVTALCIGAFYSLENSQFKGNKFAFYITYTFFALILFFSRKQMLNGELDDIYFVIRLVICFFIVHLLVATVPFGWPIKTKQDEFWHYNKNLLTSISTSAFYSALLFVGMCLALVAIQNLFGVKIKGHRFPQLFVFMTFFVNTHIFLIQSEQNFNKNNNYPIGLKYISQYVLLPLVVLYILILYAYEGKILIEWNLPKGWVSMLILVCSVIGILSFLLLYPLRNTNKWVGNFTKIFYFTLIPLLFLLAAAIYERVKNYGITEPRYFIIMLGLWLTGITIYYIISEIDNIKIIPMSLLTMAIVSIVGPVSTFSITNRSQKNQFEEVLIKHKLLVEGKIDITKETNFTTEDTEKFTSIIRHFNKRRQLGELKEYFENQKDSIFTNEKYVTIEDFYNKLPNIKLNYASKADEETQSFYAEKTSVRNISGFDYLINFNLDEINDEIKITIPEMNNIKLKNRQVIVNNSEIVDLSEFIEQITKHQAPELTDDELMIEKDLKNFKIKIQFKYLNIKGLGTEKRFESIEGEIFLKRK